jgi:PTS system ascorbate-specific IIA component
MVAVVVIAHQPLASALVAAAQHVYSRDPCAASRQLTALDVAPDAQLPGVIAAANALVSQVDRGQGVLVLTDVIGATPANVASRLARPGRVAVAAGVNLPMLLRALCYGEQSLDAVLAKALDGGAKGVQSLPPAPSTAAPQQPPPDAGAD